MNGAPGTRERPGVKMSAKGSKTETHSEQQIPFGDDNQKSDGGGADWGGVLGYSPESGQSSCHQPPLKDALHEHNYCWEFDYC